MSHKFLIPFLTAVFLVAPAAFGPAAPLGLSGSAQAADELHLNGQPHPAPKSKQHRMGGGGGGRTMGAERMGGGGGGRTK
jgi:hypothetical protein